MSWKAIHLSTRSNFQVWLAIDKIKGLKRGDTLKYMVTPIEMTEAPYGLGPYALALFLACAIRHFGDEIRLKVNPAGLGYSDTSDPKLSLM